MLTFGLRTRCQSERIPKYSNVVRGYSSTVQLALNYRYIRPESLKKRHCTFPKRTPQKKQIRSINSVLDLPKKVGVCHMYQLLFFSEPHTLLSLSEKGQNRKVVWEKKKKKRVQKLLSKIKFGKWFGGKKNMIRKKKYEQKNVIVNAQKCSKNFALRA